MRESTPRKYWFYPSSRNRVAIFGTRWLVVLRKSLVHAFAEMTRIRVDQAFQRVTTQCVDEPCCALNAFRIAGSSTSICRLGCRNARCPSGNWQLRETASAPSEVVAVTSCTLTTTAKVSPSGSSASHARTAARLCGLRRQQQGQRLIAREQEGDALGQHGVGKSHARIRHALRGGFDGHACRSSTPAKRYLPCRHSGGRAGSMARQSGIGVFPRRADSGSACKQRGRPRNDADMADVRKRHRIPAQVLPEKHRTIPRADTVFCSFFHSHPT